MGFVGGFGLVFFPVDHNHDKCLMKVLFCGVFVSFISFFFLF